MSPLPPDLIKIRDELAEEHGIRNYAHEGNKIPAYLGFRSGFDAAAQIFLEREALSNDKILSLEFLNVANWDKLGKEIDKLQSELEQARLKNKSLVEALTEATDVVIKCIQGSENRGTQRAVIPMIQKWKALAKYQGPQKDKDAK